ncbi:MAG: RsmB/NOP family class I SAM-dependent RNA methyltransferase [Verrucomicrobia bacterium]|nr:RsmB/NOP family class I SAM-dependent RNA methyltransferase [Verrucomicrobiota bacterium]
MSIAGSQQRTALKLLHEIQPHWRRDRAMPLRIESILRAHRSIGSRDRRLYRELAYTTLRYLPWIEPLLAAEPERALRLVAWLAAENKATASFRAALRGDWPERPATLADQAAFLGAEPAALLPGWFREHAPELFAPAELETQLRRAPLWLRTKPGSLGVIEAEFARLGWRTSRTDLLPTALRVHGEADVAKTESFARGLIEVQDLGSQLVLAHAAIEPGGVWLDGCAGAGGKTLQLSQLAARVDAHDIRPAALEELSARAARAGATNIRILPTPPADSYDGVLVDAPCTGSGTWRRAPHLKWTTTPEIVAEHATRQLKILTRLSARVRPGGRLIYATCSLSRHENEAVVAAFVGEHGDFCPDPTHPPRTILPSHHDTDGFFVAALRRS